MKVIMILLLLIGINNCMAEKQQLRDGIDKRIPIAKWFLTQKMGLQKVNSLDFNNAVIHTKDSLVHYIKVPYKDAQKNGFFIIKSNNRKLDCVALEMEGYKRKDTALSRYFPVVTISYPTNKLPSKTLVANRWGRIEKVIVKNSKLYEMDSIYKVVTFFLPLTNTHTQSLAIYLNMSLLFDDINTLNKQAYQDGVIIQDIIPLAFTSIDCLEFEYDNSKVLPAIDIKKMFGSFDEKADSVKKQ